MMRLAVILAFSLAALVVFIRAEEPSAVSFEAKAKGLIADKAARLERIEALRVFVCDQIKEIPTEYG